MEKTINIIKIAVASAGGVIISALGGYDKLLQFYIIAFICDLIFGALKAIKNKNFASAVMFWGFINKVIALAVIALATSLDSTLGFSNKLRNITIIWFAICEGASLLENLAALGLPIPDGIRGILAQVKKGFNINITKVVTQIIANYKVPMNEVTTEDKEGEN